MKDEFTLIVVAMVLISVLAILKAALGLAIDLEAIWAILAAAVFGAGAKTYKSAVETKAAAQNGGKK